MSTTLIEVRRAKPSDAGEIAATHDDSWRAAYQGVIPGPELDKLINRRGPDWWESAIRKGSRIAILVFGEQVAGYANYGRNRARSLYRSEEHTSELQSLRHLVCRLLLEKKKKR